MKNENKSRREFIRDLTLTGSVAFLASSPWLKTFAQEQITPAGANSRIRLACIGVGSRGTELLNNLIPVLGDINAEVIAICDDFPLHLNTALTFCKTNGINPVPYADYLALIEKEKPDGVIIAAPIYEHMHITVDCLKAGIHVFCEKSMARTLDDTKTMYDTYLTSGKILQIGHQRLFNTIYIEGIKRIRNGDLGKIGQIRAYWHRNNNWRRVLPNNDTSLEKKINWRLYKELSGGLLTELMSHQLQVSNWALNQLPVSVMGTGSIVYWNDGRTVNDNVAAIFSYPNGVKFIYDSMTSNVKYGLEEQIMGDKATIEFEVNRQYAETVPPAPGIQHLINDIENGIFNTIPVAGSTWVPELAKTYKGELILKDVAKNNSSLELPTFVKDTQLELEAFVGFIRSGNFPVEVLNQGYYTTQWSLLAEQAIDSGQQLTMPEKYLIS